MATTRLHCWLFLWTSHMISTDEFNRLSNLEKTKFLERNCPSNKVSVAKRKSHYGVGVNDSDYITQYTSKIDGGRLNCPAYACWSSILFRTKCCKFHEKNSTYIGVDVCSEWMVFSNFRKWWLENQVDGWQIDKDLIGDGTIYAPNSCIFVPSWLNKFTVDHAAARGKFPIGVSYHSITKKYKAECGHPKIGAMYIGVFSTPEDASRARTKKKLEIALELKAEMDEIGTRIYDKVVQLILRQ